MNFNLYYKTLRNITLVTILSQPKYQHDGFLLNFGIVMYFFKIKLLYRSIKFYFML